MSFFTGEYDCKLDAKGRLALPAKVKAALPDVATQETFLQGLLQLGVKATLRREKGHDIDAACGQLRLKVEREEHPQGHPS